MELKQFIKFTTQSIIDATKELIEENQKCGAFINPKMQSAGQEMNVIQFHDGFLPVTSIDFDVAVTEETEKSGGTGGKVKIAIVEFGADGTVMKSNSSVSRIQFKLRVSLPGVSGPEDGKRFKDYEFVPRKVI